MTKGTIFLSHASEDKLFVEKILKRLDASSVFYDNKTITPGQSSIDAMKDGIGSSSVFVLFHSKYTDKIWVNFEKDLAEVQKIRNKSLRIIVCPIGGETYRSLPEWMKVYMTVTTDFTVRDIARIINKSAERALLDQEPYLKKSFPGREELERSVALAIQRAPAERGCALSVVLVTGLEGMGKATLAQQIIPSAYRGMRDGGPIFTLPDAADAVDLHLRLYEDINDGITTETTEKQISVFSSLTPEQQATTLRTSLLHWGEINQVVTLRSRWGFRGRNRQLPRWFECLLTAIRNDNNMRLILISERKLPAEKIASHPHAAQFSLEQLSDETIQFILSDRIEQRFQRPEKIATISSEVHGHPATANYVAYLVNSGMSLDSLSVLPDPIYAFHDKTLDEIFKSNTLSEFQMKLLELLSWIPSLSASLIVEIFPEITHSEVVSDLWELNSFSLTTQTEGGVYAVPKVVSARFRRTSHPGSVEMFARVANILKDRFELGLIDVELLDSLVVGVVSLQGKLPDMLKGVITASTLLGVVEQEYDLGLGASGTEANDHFRRAYELSRLGLSMKASDDTLENIMFYGADAAVRIGKYPDDLLSTMRTKGFSTAHHVEGSYLYHVKRDFDGAALKLSLAVKSGHFLIRNVRLLARIYLRTGKFQNAIDALQKVEEARLRRDTGLVILKIKALHGIRSHKEARFLQKSLGNKENDYGDLAILRALKEIREGNFPEALRNISIASNAPKSNKVTLNFLKCAVEIEMGDNSNLPEAASLARAAGREADALQLQARASVVAGDWREAELRLAQIERKDYFDLAVELRVIDLKMNDHSVIRDPVEMEKCRERRQDVLRKSASTIEGSRC